MASDAKLVQLAQHGLALVVLAEIVGFEGNSRMDFVYRYCEIILDPLNLSDWVSSDLVDNEALTVRSWRILLNWSTAYA